MSFMTGSFFHTLYKRSKKAILLVALFAFLGNVVSPIRVEAALTQTQSSALISDNNTSNPTGTTPGASATKPTTPTAGGGMTEEQKRLALIKDNNPGNSPNNPANTNQPSGGSSGGTEEIYCYDFIEGLSISGCLAHVTFAILGLVSWDLWLSAVLFELAIPYTLNMADFIKDIPIVALGWATFRDVANLLFIFIILYIAIGMTIGDDSFGGKKLLGKVIVGAILINFSLFFTQAMVDASNIFSLQFYNKITQNESAKTNVASGGILDSNKLDSGISATFVNALGLKSVWDIGRSDANSEGAVGIDPNKPPEGLALNSTNLLIASIGGIILILITSFVFFAATILFLIRAVTLVFLMILSPLAFLGGVLPALGEISKKWWSSLSNNLLFAPAYMSLLYLVISIVADPNKFKGVGGSKGSFTAIFAGDTNMIPTAMTFVVLNMMMVGCLLIAGKFAGEGGKYAEKMGKGFVRGMGSFAGRNTLGRFGSSIANSDFGKNHLPGMALYGANAMAGLKFGGSSSRASLLSARTKRDEEIAKLREGKGISRRPGETDSDFKERSKLYEAGVDARMGIRRNTDGTIDYTKTGNQAFTNAQTARGKKRAGGTTGKIDDQIKTLNDKIKNNYPASKVQQSARDIKQVENKLKVARFEMEHETDPSKIIAKRAKIETLMEQYSEHKEVINGADKINEQIIALESQKANILGLGDVNKSVSSK